MSTFIYILWTIMIIILAYIIPYSVLRNVHDWSLYLFWFILALLHYVVTLVFVEKKYVVTR